jgi:hypothetical protein
LTRNRRAAGRSWPGCGAWRGCERHWLADRERWSIESWHWIRDTQFLEDKHRYRGNGAGVLATLRTAALNLLRLAGFDSIREGLQAVMHDITALLAMATRQPQEKPS